MKKNVPVGVEQVLFSAAQDPEFCQALLDGDRAAAVRQRGLELQPSELKLLAAVPAAQLRASINSMDVSPAAQQRRSFLRAVAAGAVVVTAAEALAGCGDDVETGIRPDFPYAGQPDRGTPDAPRKDAGVEAGQDGGAEDQGGKQDTGWLDIMAGGGVRPKG